MHDIDSTVLGQENRRFGGARSQPNQSSVPDGPTLASEFGFSLQCQVGSSSVLRRPIEITALTGNWLAEHDVSVNILAKCTKRHGPSFTAYAGLLPSQDSCWWYGCSSNWAYARAM
jgi:hypothetical protein